MKEEKKIRFIELQVKEIFSSHKFSSMLTYAVNERLKKGRLGQ